MHDGKMRKDILYADFVLRESARQVRASSHEMRLTTESFGSMAFGTRCRAYLASLLAVM